MIVNPYWSLYKTLKESSLSDDQLLSLRKNLIWAYSWAIPSDESVLKIASYSPMIEVGAGTGYWAWLLAQAGAKVSAYDQSENSVPRWFDVDLGQSDILSGRRESSLFLCWPPYQTKMATEALHHFDGHRVIYIGEFRGRTADEEFHFKLETDFDLIQTVQIPCWPGFRDQIYVFER